MGYRTVTQSYSSLRYVFTLPSTHTHNSVNHIQDLVSDRQTSLLAQESCVQRLVCIPVVGSSEFYD